MKYKVIEAFYDAPEQPIKIKEGVVLTIIAEYSLNGWIWGAKESSPVEFAWALINHLQTIE